MLIDFWASWCVPCREEMKVYKKMYSDIDTTQFNIMSISLDSDKDKWLHAATNDGVVWKSYYDPLAFNSNVAKTFNLTFIPFNVLIDSKGEIVALNIMSNNLNNFLSNNSLYKKQ